MKNWDSNRSKRINSLSRAVRLSRRNYTFLHMSRIIHLTLLLLLLLPLGLHAQQAQVTKRSQTPLLFPKFQTAKVRQTFGRSIEAQANIFLKDGSLLFMDGDKVKRAYTKGIIGVDFGDTARFMKVDSVMARVVAQKGYNFLLRKTTVDMPLYKEETYGGRNMDYFDIEDAGIFLNLDSQKRDDEQGIPLKDTYYFSIQGEVIPANESSFKHFVRPDRQADFKKLKENRFWSWRDEKSLKELLDFL